MSFSSKFTTRIVAVIPAFVRIPESLLDPSKGERGGGCWARRVGGPALMPDFGFSIRHYLTNVQIRASISESLMSTTTTSFAILLVFTT